MSESTQFLVNHGLTFIFVAVLLEQLGLPIPAFPWLLAAGALSRDGKFSLALGILLTTGACLVADFFWFYLGRFQGTRVLGLLCRISLEPDTCVRRTLNVFTRHGLRGIVVAKFVPGLSTVVPPLAGMSKVTGGQFLFYDGMGSLLYCGVFILGGFFFSHQITQIGATMTQIGGNALTLLVVVAAAYIGYKFWQRQRLLRELRMARITAGELRKKLDDGENPVIIDLRSRTELELSPSIIQGAIHLDYTEIEKQHQNFPRDREIVVYCDCPNEVTSAKVALSLRRYGFSRVRPLLGGIETWRQNSYPTELWTATVTGPINPNPPDQPNTPTVEVKPT